jgi:hypothetical protein
MPSKRSRFRPLLVALAAGAVLCAQATPPANRVAWLEVFPEPLPDGRPGAALEYTSQFLRPMSERSADGRTFARLDGEEWQLTADLARALGAGRLNLRLRLVDRSGGFTDGFIRSLHRTLGLPDGGREDVPDNRLAYHLERDGRTVAELDRPGLHLLDVDLAYVHPLGREDAGGRIGCSFQPPTGRRDDFSGSGTWDAMAGLAGWRRRGRWSIHGQAEQVFIHVGDANPYRAVLARSTFSRCWAGLGWQGEGTGFLGGLGVDLTLAWTGTPYRTGIGRIDAPGLQQHWTFTHRRLPGWRFGLSEEAGSYTAPDVTVSAGRSF